MEKDDGATFRQMYNGLKPGAERPAGVSWPNFSGPGPRPETVTHPQSTKQSTEAETGLRTKPTAAPHPGMADLGDTADTVTGRLNTIRYPSDAKR